MPNQEPPPYMARLCIGDRIVFDATNAYVRFGNQDKISLKSIDLPMQRNEFWESIISIMNILKQLFPDIYFEKTPGLDSSKVVVFTVAMRTEGSQDLLLVMPANDRN